MLIEIDHHCGVPIYRQIIDQVREQIMIGILREGEQLITVRELSAKLAVNPMTVSKAYSAMEMQGLLERRRGIGIFVARNVQYSQKERNKEEIIKELFSKAIKMAMQLEVSKEKTQKVFGKTLSEFKLEDK